MPGIEIHVAAEVELLESAAYYERKRKGLGGEFLDEFDAALDKIEAFPEAWPVYAGEYRRFLLRRFPYGLIYRLESDKIFLIAVAHLHRKPDYWRERDASK